MVDIQAELDARPWHGDLPALIAALDAARGQGFWVSDWDLKYLTIRIDTRDNGFLLYCDGKDDKKIRIDPERVLAVIAAHTAKWGSSRPYASMCQSLDAPLTPGATHAE